MIEAMDATAAKIVLAIQRGDSINRVESKIDVSYSWVYDWIERLEEDDVIANTDSGLRVVDHELRQQYAEMMPALYSRDTISQAEGYIIPHFAGMAFAYTEVDAAYVWTHGGYQIARDHDDYPIFITVHDRVMSIGGWPSSSSSTSMRRSANGRTPVPSMGRSTTSCSRRAMRSTPSGSMAIPSSR